ncbi:restriction endonuclease subunit S [Streptomyces sp. NPDC058629]|uniref:restriction endonuclease subunit S n=2 Tax=unclassified Streptomyces TaxID=2593676 RepID=UPI0036661EF4
MGNGSTPRRDNREYWDRGVVPWLNSSVVNQARVDSSAESVAAAALAECHLPIVSPGSVLVGLTGQGRTRGMATILDIEATVNQHLAYVTPDRARWFPDFLLWSLTAAYDDLRRISEENGSTKGGLTCEALKQLRVLVPPIDEQRAIADYLDRETARIDTLIEEQRRLVDLLRERRIAVIRHASEVVGAPVVRLGWFARVSSGDGINIDEVSRAGDSTGSVPVIGGNGVMGFGAKSNVAGSVVAIGRVGALCGNVHRVDEPAWITDNALRLDDLRDFDVDFLRWHLEGRNLNAISRSTAQPLITGSQIAALMVPMPSLAEQRRLAAYLDDETEKFDTLIKETERFIELSKERRSALITAAVTGQIDVRRWRDGRRR